MDALQAIVQAVDGKCEVYMDGGVSTGSDVFKALALGASMVFVGRSVLWGLSVGGQSGAKKVLEINQIRLLELNRLYNKIGKGKICYRGKGKIIPKFGFLYQVNFLKQTTVACAISSCGTFFWTKKS